jgi:hypothetical protein
VLERAERVIRNSCAPGYVTTTFDSISGPAQTLAYLRGQAAGKRYRQREYEAAIAFFHDQAKASTGFSTREIFGRACALAAARDADQLDYIRSLALIADAASSSFFASSVIQPRNRSTSSPAPSGPYSAVHASPLP